MNQAESLKFEKFETSNQKFQQLAIVQSMKISIALTAARHKAFALLNTGCEVNLIDRQLASKIEFIAIDDSKPVFIRTIGEKQLKTYGVHFLDLEVLDSGGTAQYF